MLYLKSLELENVRCFGKKQRIDFTSKGGKISQWTVILGDNGTGKTTILRSIVSLLPSPFRFLQSYKNNHDTGYALSINENWDKWSLKRKNGENLSKISLQIEESEKPFGVNPKIDMYLSFSLNVSKGQTQGLDDYDTNVFSPVYCFAYGANRKMATKSLTGKKLIETSSTLFDEEALLQNSEEYLLQLDYDAKSKNNNNEQINKVKKLILKVLPKGIKDIRVQETGHLQKEVQVETPFGWVAITELGLGYKTTIAWLVDFATKMIYYHEKSSTPFEEPAILVLDEIDLHMHPAWQREIIDNLTNIFPKTQFIVTAHSPLIAQSALEANLVLLKRKKDYIEVINEPDVVKSWRIDQVLTSDLFGIKEARPKGISSKINKRRKLIMKGERLSNSEREELNHLNSEIESMPVGETKPEMDAMDILKDFAKKLEIAKKQQSI